MRTWRAPTAVSRPKPSASAWRPAGTSRRTPQPHDLRVNAEITARLVPELCLLDKRAESLLRDAHDRMGLSGRGHHRTLKLARTIADLDGAEVIGPAHLAEALQYRARLDDA